MLELNNIIRETATWIHKINYNFEDNYYRSNELKPEPCQSYLDMDLNEFHTLIDKRSHYLKKNNIELLSENEISKLGQLIWSNPEESVLDGATESHAQGIYDINECPPWDTWIAKNSDFDEFKDLENVIISWLPNQHFNKFHSGKTVSFLDNMDWVKSTITENTFLQSITGTPHKLQFEETPVKWQSHTQLKTLNERWL